MNGPIENTFLLNLYWLASSQQGRGGCDPCMPAHALTYMRGIVCTWHPHIHNSSCQSLAKIADWESQGVEQARELLQELSELLYWEGILQGAAWMSGDRVLFLAARWARLWNFRYRRYLCRALPGVPYEVIERDIIVVPAWGIRCEPTPPNPGFFL